MQFFQYFLPKNRSNAVNSNPYSPVVAGVAGGGRPGGTVGAIVAQPKDMEINIDRHKDRKTKATLLFVNWFIVFTTCQNQLQFLNEVFPLTWKTYIYMVCWLIMETLKIYSLIKLIHVYLIDYNNWWERKTEQKKFTNYWNRKASRYAASKSADLARFGYAILNWVPKISR